MHYAIGDVHGCFDELNRLMKKINERDDDAIFIFVGDIIDRGPKVWETLQWFMKKITDDGKYQCLRGNHEQMIIDWYFKEYLYWEKKNFGIIPHTKYDFYKVLIENECTEKEKVYEIVRFFESLPCRKEINININGKEIKYSIVHAGDSFDESLTEEDREYINLNLRDNGLHNTDTVVVHGHTPTVSRYYHNDRPGLIGYRLNDICIDGGCCFGEMFNKYPTMLCAICLETLEEFYSDSILERMRLNNSNLSSDEIEMLSEKYKNEYLSKTNPYRRKLEERFSL